MLRALSPVNVDIKKKNAFFEWRFPNFTKNLVIVEPTSKLVSPAALCCQSKNENSDTVPPLCLASLGDGVVIASKSSFIFIHGGFHSLLML